MRTAPARPVLALVLTLGGLAACGDDSGENLTASQTSFDQADVAFVQSMIPHHEEAVRMAALAAGRAHSSEVKKLAARIRDAQQPEIDLMKAWLQQWGRPLAMPSSMPGMDMTATMPGMMSRADLAKLRAARGTAFDRLFLTMMVAHHQGAIAMARTEIATGKFPAALDLARAIERAQSAEITEMNAMRA